MLQPGQACKLHELGWEIRYQFFVDQSSKCMGQLIEEMTPFYLKSLDQHFLSFQLVQVQDVVLM